MRNKLFSGECCELLRAGLQFRLRTAMLYAMCASHMSLQSVLPVNDHSDHYRNVTVIRCYATEITRLALEWEPRSA
jgi:hypothetical protein